MKLSSVFRRTGLATGLCASLLSVSSTVCAVELNRDIAFDDYVEQLKSQALNKGISEQTVTVAFADVELRTRVVKSDRAQPERQKQKVTMDDYLGRVLPKWKVDLAREKYVKYYDELQEIGAKYGVQPRFIVALWGVESNFGRYTGNQPVISSLTTLAYEGRREAFFTRELMAALQILDEGHISAADMKGSWAGAMGQSQFMPSSFLAFAQDYDGNGRKDIWNDQRDVFASIANYLAQTGWDDTATWGRQVTLASGMTIDKAELGLSNSKTLAQWQALGVRRYDGSGLPLRDLKASLLMPDGANGRIYLVYDNYKTLMKWNRSTFFATSVGFLADQIVWPAPVIKR